MINNSAGWSSPVARQAHNLKVVGSNPTPATKTQINQYFIKTQSFGVASFFVHGLVFLATLP